MPWLRGHLYRGQVLSPEISVEPRAREFRLRSHLAPAASHRVFGILDSAPFWAGTGRSLLYRGLQITLSMNLPPRNDRLHQVTMPELEAAPASGDRRPGRIPRRGEDPEPEMRRDETNETGRGDCVKDGIDMVQYH